MLFRSVVVTGFDPVDVMAGMVQAVELLESDTAQVANAYGRVVRAEGNPNARSLLEEVFVAVDQPWRGMGVIPGGGLALRPPYDSLDARRRFALPQQASAGVPACTGCGEVCISGAVLQGQSTPDQCPAFGGACTPAHPLGAPMVSSEAPVPPGIATDDERREGARSGGAHSPGPWGRWNLDAAADRSGTAKALQGSFPTLA